MARKYNVGEPAILEATFRDGVSGNLIDPDDATLRLTVKRGNASVAFDELYPASLQIVRVSLGLFLATVPTDAVKLGTKPGSLSRWEYAWTGLFDGVEQRVDRFFYVVRPRFALP